jgi:hypothetical protein
VLSRAEWPTLPGAYVTFAGGPFKDRRDAELARDRYATLGFVGEVILIGR